MTQDRRLLMREINDRIYEVLAKSGSEDGDFLCECGSDGCTETVQLTLREHAAARANAQFVTVREHRQLRAVS
jgi:hypothetical protein